VVAEHLLLRDPHQLLGEEFAGLANEWRLAVGLARWSLTYKIDSAH